MEGNHSEHTGSSFLLKAAGLIFFWILLFALLVSILIYSAFCIYLDVYPLLTWADMDPMQRSMLICLCVCVPTFSILLTLVMIVIYERIIYFPVKTLLSKVDRASGYEGRTDHAEIYLSGGRRNLFDLNHPRQQWTDRVKDYIDNVTKERYFDDTTGCFNRKYFSQAMTDVLKTQMLCSLSFNSNPLTNANYYFSIYMIDIDHFKYVNDQFGHGSGDRILSIIGSTLRSVVEPSGIVIRYGGEEFLIIDCLSYPFDFSRLAKKIKSEFRKKVYIDIENSSEKYPITCSIGYTPFPLFLQNKTAMSVEQHVNLSDQAMYLAKSEGRDTWRGIDVVSTPKDHTAFEKTGASLEYGIHSGYIRICQPEASPGAAQEFRKDLVE